MTGARPLPGRRLSATLPLRYLLAAALAFVLAALGVPWLAGELAGHYYHPRVLALTHTVTLGWITLAIMGASYQLIPIVLERPIWSERLARWQFVILAAGVVGMVGHLYIAQWHGLVWGAALAGAGVGAHILNAGLSVRGLKHWTFTARLVVLALTGLGLTALFGLALGADKIWRFLPGTMFGNLHAHFHLALLGWVLPVVLGVAARVYPMFLLAREPAGWPGHLQLWGLVLGVPAVVLGLLAESPLVIPSGFLVAAAVAGHLVWIGAIARSRKRPALDWGLRFALTGAAFLPVATAMGLGLALDLLSGPRLGLAYAVLALGGWVSLTIVGMMLKIVPFLVWYRAYGPWVGRAPVPTLAELSWPTLEGVTYGFLVAGVVVLAVGTAAGDAGWIRAAGGLLTGGALGFGATLARVLCHLRATRSLAGAVREAPAP
ncbi:MAG: hypothetical protein HY727_05435 [Candidatus Rokubacteria bacterium]|nr:hypothetical protein [Candidatus Rokubacteria bacterium]